jgi:hypothetical protein
MLGFKSVTVISYTTGKESDCTCRRNVRIKDKNVRVYNVKMNILFTSTCSLIYLQSNVVGGRNNADNKRYHSNRHGKKALDLPCFPCSVAFIYYM